jgi:hypothetical protein
MSVNKNIDQSTYDDFVDEGNTFLDHLDEWYEQFDGRSPIESDYIQSARRSVMDAVEALYRAKGANDRAHRNKRVGLTK